METATTLYLIRHAEVHERYHKVFGGSRVDMELSQTGHAQADRLARYMNAQQVGKVYTSPMLRVQQTLSPLLGRNALPVTPMDGLKEVDFGAWTGFKWDEIQQRFGVSAFDWLDVLDRSGIPEGESGVEVLNRVKPCLKQVLSESQGQTAAVYCHGGVVRAILSLLLEVPLRKTSMFEVDYASLTRLEMRRGRVEIDLMNFTPWRDLKCQC